MKREETSQFFIQIQSRGMHAHLPLYICQKWPENMASQAHYTMSDSKWSNVYIFSALPLMVLSICRPEESAAVWKLILFSVIGALTCVNLLKRFSELLPQTKNFRSWKNIEEPPPSFPKVSQDGTFLPMRQDLNLKWQEEKLAVLICLSTWANRWQLGTYGFHFPDLLWAPCNLYRVYRAARGWL